MKPKSDEADLANHPCQVSYEAGIRAWSHWRMSEQEAKTNARQMEDRESFMDGYWTARHGDK
jgi:hypothetical protein